MIIAIYGPSCTGKTTITGALRDAFGLPLRSCGEEVRRRAEVVGLSWDELPDDQHRAIDTETLLWVASNRPCLVEGRFLDRVLGPLGHDVTFVRLEASAEERLQRWTVRAGRSLSLEELREADALNLAFRARIYMAVESAVPSLILSTSELSVEACVQSLKAFIKADRAPHI
ncbi:MAG: AAA family ATPase [bacterium]